VNLALQSLPKQDDEGHWGNSVLVKNGAKVAELRKKPDFVTVTRGPGMLSNLNVGLDTAKGLAVAWQIPLLGVNHMQAHALTPRLVASLNGEAKTSDRPEFPFLTLLVSGGHTMLVHSKELCNHKILAQTTDIAIGDVIDKCARDIIPEFILNAGKTTMYGPVLESYAFRNGPEDYQYTPPATKSACNGMVETEYGWGIRPPLSKGRMYHMEFSFSGLGAVVRRVMEARPIVPEDERRVLAREAMRIAFEHLGSRVLLALQEEDVAKVSTLVVSGGVAANQYLKHILRAMLDVRGFQNVKLDFPPPALCTDNAAMIAWTGIEMWEAGWRTDLNVQALKKWPLDPDAQGGGIFGADGWIKAA
jgi:N6-L-threonylcarbamoyladenine synthase